MTSVIERVARRHGLRGTPIPLAGGLVNDAWQVGEHVVRIVQKDGCDDEAARERAVVPLVVAAGVRTPPLIAAELTSDLSPRPYTIYQRVEGVLLGNCEPDPRFEPTYRELGRQAARISQVTVADDDVLRRHGWADPRDALAKTRAAGAISEADAADLAAWLDAIEPRLGAPAAPVFLHRDLHPWNLLVDADHGTLTAIIDWGDAGLGDPACELGSMPLYALPAMLDGYREDGGAIDDGFVARVLWIGIALAMWELRELDPAAFDRRWWRMPPGGWPAMRAWIERELPALAP